MNIFGDLAAKIFLAFCIVTTLVIIGFGVGYFLLNY